MSYNSKEHIRLLHIERMKDPEYRFVNFRAAVDDYDENLIRDYFNWEEKRLGDTRKFPLTTFIVNQSIMGSTKEDILEWRKGKHNIVFLEKDYRERFPFPPNVAVSTKSPLIDTIMEVEYSDENEFSAVGNFKDGVVYYFYSVDGWYPKIEFLELIEHYLFGYAQFGFD